MSLVEVLIAWQEGTWVGQKLPLVIIRNMARCNRNSCLKILISDFLLVPRQYQYSFTLYTTCHVDAAKQQRRTVVSTVDNILCIHDSYQEATYFYDIAAHIENDLPFLSETLLHSYHVDWDLHNLFPIYTTRDFHLSSQSSCFIAMEFFFVWHLIYQFLVKRKTIHHLLWSSYFVARWKHLIDFYYGICSSPYLNKKIEDRKREEEGDQEGRAGTIFFASGRLTKAVFRQNSA